MGLSNRKALEIYNFGPGAVDFDAAGVTYAIEKYSNGSTSGLTYVLTGTVAAGDVFVAAHSSASAAILAVADQTNGGWSWNGDDALELTFDDGTRAVTVLDSVGEVGFDPGSQWGSGDLSTQNNTIIRKPSISVGDSDSSDDFEPELVAEWIGHPQDYFDDLGQHRIPEPATAMLLGFGALALIRRRR